MNKTILLRKRQDTDMDYDIEIIVKFDIKQNDDYVVIDESKSIYCKIANLILDVMSDKEDTEQLSELEEEINLYEEDDTSDLQEELDEVNEYIKGVQCEYKL